MNKFMEMAIEEAKLGIVEGHGGPFGCVIVKDGVVVGKGHNEVIKNNDPTCHGEMMAIHDACKNLKTFNLKGCELYTTGEPCPMCLSAIIWANIKVVYYANTRKDADDIGFRDDMIYEYIKGNSKNLIEVHHIDRDRTNNAPDNLIVLCANHHTKLHRGGLEITEEIKSNRQFK